MSRLVQEPLPNNNEESIVIAQGNLLETLYGRIEKLEKTIELQAQKIDRLKNDQVLKVGVGKHTILEVESMAYLGYYHGIMTSVNAHSKVRVKIYHKPSEGHQGWGYLESLLPDKWKKLFGTTHEALLDAQQFANLITFFCTGGGDVTDDMVKNEIPKF